MADALALGMKLHMPILVSVLVLSSIACAAPEEDGTSIAGVEEVESDAEALTGNFPVGTALRTKADVNLRKGPSRSDAVLKIIDAGTVVKSASGTSRDGWYGVTFGGTTGWVYGVNLEKDSGSTGGNTGDGAISAKGQEQMRNVLAYAKSHNTGSSAGMCFRSVWGYLTSSGYGTLSNWNDAPAMKSGEARYFAEYMNAGNNAASHGLRRLNISNPYDAPVGSVVVVAAGSPMTRHPTAGDIAIAAGGGLFINDGPRMDYGPKADFMAAGGRMLGVYVPR
jgi:uncharacterized protein YgiM (DUF1202 family)